nr:diguanylate cyclase [Gammaproteobacteria bacterium]
MESGLSNLWLVFALVLVLSMQAGFLMLEGGRVRSKNSINVAQKNITDLVVVWMVFLLAGFTLMYGVSVDSIVSGEATILGVTPIHFMYQVAFCGTTATIVSGAVAERMSFRSYLLLVAVIGAIIYPVVGRLVWGNTYNPEVDAWLATLGFMDFAGGTVVHGVGAWIALVAIIMIGPRTGRFDEHGNPQVMPAHNAVIALFGVFILMFGWLGFNGGSISPEDPLLQQVLFNTLTTAAFGGGAGMLVGVLLDKGIFNPARVTSGLLGGLVCGTAGINLVNAYEAMFLGALGGVVATYTSHIILYRFKLDDPLDVVATHGVAGVVGTLAIPFVGPVSALAASTRTTQLGIQLAGVVAIFIFCTLVTFAALLLIKRITPIRVSIEAEKIGLNYTEHGEGIGIDRLQSALNSKIASNDSFADGIVIDSGDEHSELASTLNEVIQKYEEASQTVAQARQRFQQFAETASDWLWEAAPDLTITFLHANSLQSSDIPLSDCVGRNLLDSLQLNDAEAEQIKICVANGEPTPVFESKLIIPGDRLEPFAVEVRGVPNRDSEGSVIGYRGTITDISVRKTAEDKALYLAIHDELTGLPNRRALSENLKREIREATRNDKAVVVAGVDLDGFKAVNDTYGHLVGDKLLKLVAARLSNFLRPKDTAYRTGGDEFVIIFSGWERESALEIGNTINTRMIEELSAPYAIQNLDIRVGISVGLAAFPEHSKEVLDLLRMADLALYDAKDSGKGCVACFNQALD